MTRRSSRKAGWLGTTALILSLAALAFASVPAFQRAEASPWERFTSDIRNTWQTSERHILDESRFQLRFTGPEKWISLAMIAAIAGAVLGLLALGTEFLSGLAALIIGGGLIAFLFLSA